MNVNKIYIDVRWEVSMD